MKTHIPRLLLLALFSVALAAITAPALARPVYRDLGSEVDAYIEETIRRLPIPGLAVGIVRGDEVLYFKGYGTANKDGDPVTPQTPFMLASVTKSFTALAIQQLAQTGKLDLDEPVQTYLPDFRLADERGGATVTVRHLLEHTSGISTIQGSQPYLHSPDTTFELALGELGRYRPQHEPGEFYEYSNWNYALLGEVVARASGRPYVEYMQENILDPLVMPRASFADPHTIPGAATGNLIVFGLSVPYDEPYVPAMLSAGYLTASAEEMTHYLVAFLNQGRYNGRTLLASQGEGWYDMYWNWQSGRPGDLDYSFSGAHNSINTNIELFSHYQVGVVVLMNTRLEQGIPGPDAHDIAFNLARLVIQSPYEVPSARAFYVGYAVVDVLLLVLIGSILWQAGSLRDWRMRCRSAVRWERAAAWAGVIADLIIFAAITLLPILAGSRWNILLYFRPDFAVPLLAIGLSLGALALLKIYPSRSEHDIRRNETAGPRRLRQPRGVHG